MDDPYWFGQIAAANALSDIYAMGGRPLTALNLVMFPMKKLGGEVLKEILRGGSDKVSEAGASIAGGHSVDDNEPKYGLAVTGVVHPNHIFTNSGAKDGDALVLTKPLGTGVLFNACRSRKLPWSDLEPLLSQVASLNNKAMEIASEFDIHACTDITGFGLIGHALEVAKGSGVGLDLNYGGLPLYPGAIDMYRKGETTGSDRTNRQLSEGFLRKIRHLSRAEEELLFDPQTSGGLLISLPADKSGPFITKLKDAGINAASDIGKVVSSPEDQIRIL